MKKLISLMSAVIMIFTLTGCDFDFKFSDEMIEKFSEAASKSEDEIKNKTGSTAESATQDKISNQSNSQTSSSASSSASNSATNSATNSGNSSSSSAESGVKEVYTKINPVIPNANVIGGKSWAEVKASMPASLGKKLVICNWNPLSEYTGVAEVIEKFRQETGITVEWKLLKYGTFQTQLDGFIASGNAPDLARTLYPDPTRFLSFQPISVSGYDFNDAAWDKNLMDAYSVNGKCYAMSLKNTHYGSVTMAFYNKSLIDKHGLEDPYNLWISGKWNIEKFIELNRKYVSLTGNRCAVTGITPEEWTSIYGLTGNIAKVNGRFVNMTGHAELRAVLSEFASYYYDQGLFNRGQAEVFDGNGALFYIGGSVFARKDNSYFGYLKSTGNMYCVPMPSAKNGATYYQLRDEYEAYAIPKNASNPQAAPYFLRYFLDGKNYNLDTFFCNKQNLEVYNWCMAQPNAIWGFTYYDPTYSIYTTYSKNVNQHLYNTNNTVQQQVDKLNGYLNML